MDHSETRLDIESRFPRDDSERRFKIRVGIGLALAVIGLACVFFFYVAYHRSRGGDQLIEKLDKLGAEYEFQQDKTEIGEVSGWSRFLGTSTEPITHIKLANTTITNQVAKSLSNNLSTRNVEVLRFENVQVEKGAPMFFGRWRPISRLVIDSTTLPESWWREIENVPDIQFLDLKNVRAIWMYGDCRFLRKVERIRFQKCRLTSRQLAAIKKSVPRTQLQVVASYLDTETLSKKASDFEGNTRTFSDHDEKAFEEMQVVFDRLHQEMQKLEPPGSNQLNPPASLEQIGKLERLLGMPMLPEMRAYLECHDGQPDKMQELVSGEWLLPIDQIIERYLKWQGLAYQNRDLVNYDFDSSLTDPENPNLLPIAASEGNVISIHLVDGYLTRGTGDADPVRLAPSLKAYLLRIVERIETGKFTRVKASDSTESLITVEGWK